MDRSPQEVAESHLAAVVAGDTTAMAADYSEDAVLERGADIYRGHAAITAYFASVPDRLGDAVVVFDSVEVDDDVVTFSWHLDGAPVAASGTDVCRIARGAIIHQVVRLDASDF